MNIANSSSSVPDEQVEKVNRVGLPHVLVAFVIGIFVGGTLAEYHQKQKLEEVLKKLEKSEITFSK